MTAHEQNNKGKINILVAQLYLRVKFTPQLSNRAM